LLAALFCAGAASSTLAADKMLVGRAQRLAWAFLPLLSASSRDSSRKYGSEVEIVALAGDRQGAAGACLEEHRYRPRQRTRHGICRQRLIAVAAFAGAPRNISAIVLADSPVKNVADLTRQAHRRLDCRLADRLACQADALALRR
jgi:hypothetical protein